jgi:hypothetical protein
MTCVVLTCKFIVAGVFGWAAFGKLRRPADRRAFADVLAAGGLARPPVAVPAAAAVGGVEGLLAALVLLPPTAAAGLTAAAGWTVALTWALRRLRRRSVDCRCFGSAVPVGVRHVIRNVALFTVAGAGALGSAAEPAGPVRWPAVLVAATGAATALLAVALTDQLLVPPAAPARPS